MRRWLALDWVFVPGDARTSAPLWGLKEVGPRMTVLDSIQKYGAALSVLIAAVPVIWGMIVFVLSRRAEAKRSRFETYHALIKQLVDRESPEQSMKLDRQIAVVYELRAFRHYEHVTRRILSGLRQHWTDTKYGPTDKLLRLVHEVDLTLADLKRSRLDRLLRRNPVDPEA